MYMYMYVHVHVKHLTLIHTHTHTHSLSPTHPLIPPPRPPLTVMLCYIVVFRLLLPVLTLTTPPSLSLSEEVQMTADFGESLGLDEALEAVDGLGELELDM
jgi:hypothetical protein